jgi:hypothetical protein
MRWREVKELAGMLMVLGTLVGAGWGLSSLTADPQEVVDVREAPGAPAAVAPVGTGGYEAAGPAAPVGSIEPVGRPSGG